jgi:hypothetical protein
MRRGRRNRGDGEPVKLQREVVRDVMLLAAPLDAWMTLEELGNKTKYPQASISAQLRHLRKREHGGFVVEKRRRKWEEAKKEGVHEMVWEYQVRRGSNEIAK